jgi:chemosensory pili system protein ChpA (sensor histidine kinase/response regulator)
MTTVSARLPDGYPRQKNFMAIEMASAFLLVESIIENFTSPPDDLRQQVGIMGDWLLDAATGKSTGNPPAGLRTDLTQQIGALQLRAQVAKEILTNLQHVEQVLDAFARDPSVRHTLPGLKPYLRQIHGALVVLDFDLAMEVTSICDSLIGECARADHPRIGQDMDTIAEGLSSLVYFIEPCLNGREPADRAITLFFERFNARRVPAAERAPLGERAAPVEAIEDIAADVAPFAAAPAAGEPRPATVAPAPAPVDAELLAIFLEEAGEVLATVDATLPVCREKPHDRDALAVIRRGFHTLKGSGRMVHLTDLGELAWEIEQVANRFLEGSRPATPELLELITTGSAVFSEGIGRLRAGEPLALDARHIVDLAHRLKSLEEPAAEPELRDSTGRAQATPPPPAQSTPRAADAEIPPPAAPAPAPPAGAPPLLPKGREMRTMFDDLDERLLPVFLEGAQELLPMIGGSLREWKSSPGGLNHAQSLLRALRTLKGSARMAGAIRLGELTHIMERRVEAAVEASKFPPALFEDLESKMDRLSFDVERMGLDLERTKDIRGAQLVPGAAPLIEVAPEAPPTAVLASMLRINAGVPDRLTGRSEEVGIARSHIEAELRLARQSLSDLNDSLARLRTQLREVEILLSRLE